MKIASDSQLGQITNPTLRKPRQIVGEPRAICARKALAMIESIENQVARPHRGTRALTKPWPGILAGPLPQRRLRHGAGGGPVGQAVAPLSAARLIHHHSHLGASPLTPRWLRSRFSTPAAWSRRTVSTPIESPLSISHIRDDQGPGGHRPAPVAIAPALSDTRPAGDVRRFQVSPTRRGRQRNRLERQPPPRTQVSAPPLAHVLPQQG